VETIETGGDELLERMRTSPDLRAVPLILVAEQEPTVERLSRFPSAHWLVKPISQSQFLETVESALGRGSAGSFPSLQQAPAAPVVLPSATGRDSLLRVLLVEDIVENQLLTSELLRQRGHSIVVASHGREALQAFEQQRFDVVLMDIQMPEMGGVEATLLIRQREKETGASRTPIIAVTAHAIKGDRGRYLKAGMDGYVSKPIRRQQLYDEIDSLVGPGSASASAPARGQGPGVSVL
jgi:CheY-like chemotaxis protein